MTSRTRRSFIRLCCAGATVGALGSTERVRAASESAPNASAFETEQARYVSKFADEAEWAFKELLPLFDPPSDEELEQYFEDSYTPSVASLLPGIVGDAVDLAETLSWYETVSAESGFRHVSDRGPIDSPTDDLEGGGGDEMDAARQELDGIVEQCAAVRARAQTCEADPSASNVEQLADAMATLSDDLDQLDAVDRWATISPDAYQGTHPTAVQAAERVQGNAEAVLDIASALSNEISDQRETVAGDGYLPFPSAVVTFGHAVSDIRSQVPGFIFDRFAGDSFHIRTENASGEELSVRWIDTDASGAITSYELVEQDSADADIVLTESTLTDIVDAEDSMATAVEQYQSGDVQVSGNGFFNSIKYSKYFGTLIDWLAGIF